MSSGALTCGSVEDGTPVGIAAAAGAAEAPAPGGPPAAFERREDVPLGDASVTAGTRDLGGPQAVLGHQLRRRGHRHIALDPGARRSRRSWEPGAGAAGAAAGSGAGAAGAAAPAFASVSITAMTSPATTVSPSPLTI